MNDGIHVTLRLGRLRFTAAHDGYAAADLHSVRHSQNVNRIRTIEVASVIARLTLGHKLEQIACLERFQDGTNGSQTYGGGRVLSAPTPKDGLTTLDFNKSVNPYCAVNPFAICPLAPAVNR